MLFVDGVTCEKECNPDRYNAVRFRSAGLSIGDVRKAVSVTDITDPAHEVALEPKPFGETYFSLSPRGGRGSG